MRSWFPTCSYRASGPSISEQPNQMTPSFGSRRRGKRLALPKHLWEKRREKRSRSYQSEHACSAPLRSCSLVSIFLSSERCNEGESRCPRSEAARTHRELLEGK